MDSTSFVIVGHEVLVAFLISKAAKQQPGLLVHESINTMIMYRSRNEHSVFDAKWFTGTRLAVV